MMTKHTPGPWVGEDFGERPMPIYADIGGETSLICEAHQPDGPESCETQNANARLIAAAPELLAALEMLSYFPGSVEARKQARAAIAKAKGE